MFRWASGSGYTLQSRCPSFFAQQRRLFRRECRSVLHCIQLTPPSSLRPAGRCSSFFCTAAQTFSQIRAALHPAVIQLTPPASLRLLLSALFLLTSCWMRRHEAVSQRARRLAESTIQFRFDLRFGTVRDIRVRGHFWEFLKIQLQN